MKKAMMAVFVVVVTCALLTTSFAQTPAQCKAKNVCERCKTHMDKPKCQKAVPNCGCKH